MLFATRDLAPLHQTQQFVGQVSMFDFPCPGAWRCKVPSWPQLDRLDTVVFISGRSHVDHWRLVIYLFNVTVYKIIGMDLPMIYPIIYNLYIFYSNEWCITLQMPFYGTSKLVSKTSRDDAPCPTRGLFDAPSRGCWQLEPLKKERPSGHAIAGIPTVSVWPNPRRNACLMRFGRSMAVSMAFVLSSIWERYDNVYLRCQKVSTLHEEYSKIDVIHI